MMNKAIRALAVGLMLTVLFPLVSWAASLEKSTLQLHFQKNNVFVPHAVAIKKGWFKEAGFKKVEVRTFTAGALAGEALLAGEVDVWAPGNVPVIAMRHNGIPVVIAGHLCSVYEKLVIRPDAKVKNPEDLYKIRIGLLQGSTASAVLDNLANHYGLDVNRIKTVNLPPPEQVSAMVSNRVQGIIVWEPFASKAKISTNGKFLFESNTSHFAKDRGMKYAASHTLVPLVFTEDFMKENPKSTRAIISVLIRATEYITKPENKEEAIRIFAEMTERSVVDVRQDWNDIFYKLSIDGAYLEDMTNYTNFMENAGRIRDAVSPLMYTNTKILEQINPKYVKIRGLWKP